MRVERLGINALDNDQFAGRAAGCSRRLASRRRFGARGDGSASAQDARRRADADKAGQLQKAASAQAKTPIEMSGITHRSSPKV